MICHICGRESTWDKGYCYNCGADFPEEEIQAYKAELAAKNQAAAQPEVPVQPEAPASEPVVEVQPEPAIVEAKEAQSEFTQSVKAPEPPVNTYNTESVVYTNQQSYQTQQQSYNQNAYAKEQYSQPVYTNQTQSPVNQYGQSAYTNQQYGQSAYTNQYNQQTYANQQYGQNSYTGQTAQQAAYMMGGFNVTKNNVAKKTSVYRPNILGIIAALCYAIGAFLPYLTDKVFGSSISTSLISKKNDVAGWFVETFNVYKMPLDGIIVLAIAVVALIFSVSDLNFLVLIAGLLGAFVSVVELIFYFVKASELSSLGPAVFLLIIGAVVMLIAGMSGVVSKSGRKSRAKMRNNAF